MLSLSSCVDVVLNPHDRDSRDLTSSKMEKEKKKRRGWEETKIESPVCISSRSTLQLLRDTFEYSNVIVK